MNTSRKAVLELDCIMSTDFDGVCPHKTVFFKNNVNTMCMCALHKIMCSCFDSMATKQKPYMTVA